MDAVQYPNDLCLCLNLYLHNAVSDLWREKLEHCGVLNPLSGLQSDAHPSSEVSRRVGWVGLVATCGGNSIVCYSCKGSNEKFFAVWCLRYIARTLHTLLY